MSHDVTYINGDSATQRRQSRERVKKESPLKKKALLLWSENDIQDLELPKGGAVVLTSC